MKKKLCIIIVTIVTAVPVFAWETFDRVIAVVNDTAIIQSELMRRYQIVTKKQTPKKPEELNSILDNLIERALIEQEAREQAIIISDEKVMTHIHNIMKSQKIPSLDVFKKMVEEKEGISFEEYKEEIRQSLLTEMLVSLAIGVSPPSRDEAYQWYKENKNKLGNEVHIKQIVIRPKNSSFAEEKRANELINQIRDRILKGESFEKLASQYSEDPSAKNGGDIGWIALAEMDPYMANTVFRMKKPGEISTVIKTQTGYTIVKLIDSRPTSFETVQDRILNMLYQRNMGEQFKKWIVTRRAQSDIKIYLENYRQS
ncbi:MAG TPA: peptidylprolyl isomerase [Spirochaetota bacterium]|nr:peptidylprolyl isomerase [Spirochaetota bacterium]HOM09979.1 peptidylprolyl isomerase [Spirochaetota bacterium]HPP49830.1 peptidylprolyl isomerase [Spirochaetota bacterium]HXK65674.1 peptidylprolyl isomerase [Spirochaetota bacterium]